jgi:hypothetical protein
LKKIGEICVWKIVATVHHKACLKEKGSGYGCAVPHAENSQANSTLWECAMHAISGMGEEKTPVTEKIRMWHGADNRIGIARSATQGIIVPTEHLIKHLEHKGYKQLNKLMGAMEPLWAQCNILLNNTDNIMEENPGMQPDGILNTMEAFVK